MLLTIMGVDLLLFLQKKHRTQTPSLLLFLLQTQIRQNVGYYILLIQPHHKSFLNQKLD